MPRASAISAVPSRAKDRSVIFIILLGIIQVLIKVIVTVVIVQFVLSMLITFNVVSLNNKFVAAVWQALNAILEPILGPVRRHMPDTGVLDLSPMVVIMGLSLLQNLLEWLNNGILS